jgi:hypothetical protein
VRAASPEGDLAVGVGMIVTGAAITTAYDGSWRGIK